ncbi:MAG TPA: 2,3,4,5-tetrahydropyridine-2,6-dicarboxylate N-succinyltransferase [Anaeromyxobacteraceae bacterium]|nr:2,3,4,5-tetrahydropyridine-2,6-dicarboxylate N-succinyltransferase [Anaeromyxobacteraceae bacterium]HZY02220.1 2,3,4,5-tetrahydropyridine-2,6-dicarboxylate N-succinyltransferase [Anaeromyxobacteraceae bacterium]
MSHVGELEARIAAAWAEREKLKEPVHRAAVLQAVHGLDKGELRVAEKVDGEWRVNAWLMQAVNLYFAVAGMETHDYGPFQVRDKIPLKRNLEKAGVRLVPGGVVRYGAYVAPGAVVMPGFVNIGARVGAGTMVDTWATVGSCAQVGQNVHLAGGVGIGGVLEPPGARPNIVEDDCFVGSRCILVEGVLVEEGSVLGANVVITASTPIIDVTGPAEVVHRQRVPPRSVVIPGTRPKQYPAGTFYVPCALIVGRRSAATDKKVSLNDALRDFEVQV